MAALPGLVTRLPPRGLALFARTMASLFSKPEPPLDASRQPGLDPHLPPPECVPPHLCAACANRQLLCDVPHLAPKLVQLLRSPRPPRKLWPARHLFLPTGHAIEVGGEG